ncbi:MAG: hypothetical protein C4299_02320 [Thermoleophilia bacterium]
MQWYADVCLEHGVDEAGVPWYADLYLDVISLPGGGFIVIDADELEAALKAGEVSHELYDLAWREAKTLLEQMQCGELELLKVSLRHLSRFI